MVLNPFAEQREAYEVIVIKSSVEDDGYTVGVVANLLDAQEGRAGL